MLALRVAAGIADDRTPDRFSAGGVSGSSVSIISGYAVGGQRRTFGVRGYPAGAEAGIRAMSGSLRGAKVQLEAYDSYKSTTVAGTRGGWWTGG